MPLSYGTLSHLCASVAQESARSAPATRCRRRGLAAAQSPKAPSTCSQAPASSAASAIASSGSNGAGVHVPRLGADDRRARRASASASASASGSIAALAVGLDRHDAAGAEAEEAERAVDRRVPLLARDDVDRRRADQAVLVHVPARRARARRGAPRASAVKCAIWQPVTKPNEDVRRQPEQLA